MPWQDLSHNSLGNALSRDGPCRDVLVFCGGCRVKVSMFDMTRFASRRRRESMVIVLQSLLIQVCDWGKSCALCHQNMRVSNGS